MRPSPLSQRVRYIIKEDGAAESHRRRRLRAIEPVFTRAGVPAGIARESHHDEGFAQECRLTERCAQRAAYSPIIVIIIIIITVVKSSLSSSSLVALAARSSRVRPPARRHGENSASYSDKQRDRERERFSAAHSFFVPYQKARSTHTVIHSNYRARFPLFSSPTLTGAVKGAQTNAFHIIYIFLSRQESFIQRRYPDRMASITHRCRRIAPIIRCNSPLLQCSRNFPSSGARNALDFFSKKGALFSSERRAEAQPGSCATLRILYTRRLLCRAICILHTPQVRMHHSFSCTLCAIIILGSAEINNTWIALSRGRVIFCDARFFLSFH